MKVELLEQPNISVALFGLGKNKGVTSGIKYRDFTECTQDWKFNCYYEHDAYKKMLNKLCDLPDEHRKFLRQIPIVIEVTAPIYWWSEFDTYKIGTTAQSESTMHTILKQKVSQDSFAYGSDDCVIESVLDRIDTVKQFKCNDTEKTIEIKKIIPESFLQCRVVTLNYEVFKNIYLKEEIINCRNGDFFAKDY